MDKKIKVLSASVMAGMFAFSSVASAETANFNVGLTVQNAFTLTKDADLDFGTIRALADPAGSVTATYALSPNPAVNPNITAGTPGTANLALLVPGAPGSFSISGVSPFASLAITDPGAADISASTAPPGTPVFGVSAFTYYITSGPNANNTYTGTGAGALQADATGAVSFNVGATITTDDAVTTQPYADAAYSGSFVMTVNYQ
jgi:hypothetical protein